MLAGQISIQNRAVLPRLRPSGEHNTPSEESLLWRSFVFKRQPSLILPLPVSF